MGWLTVGLFRGVNPYVPSVCGCVRGCSLSWTGSELAAACYLMSASALVPSTFPVQSGLQVFVRGYQQVAVKSLTLHACSQCHTAAAVTGAYGCAAHLPSDCCYNQVESDVTGRQMLSAACCTHGSNQDIATPNKAVNRPAVLVQLLHICMSEL